MHDFMNDLATWISGGICLHLRDDNESNYDIKFEKIRHLSFVTHYYEVAKRFEKFSLSVGLRTFIAFDRYVCHSVLSNVVLDKVITNMRCLKLLCLNGYCIKKLPHSISELKQLRHLDMSYTQIRLLPESISSLLNLQILKLNNCSNLIQLPREIRNLISLRLLDISYTDNLKVMPPGIGCLRNLQILQKFIVGENDGLRLKELKELSCIRGELSIWGLEKVVDIQDARDANLKAKQNLVSLEFQWMEETSTLEQEKQVQVLDELQPHTSLKRLEISGYNGKHFPRWVGDHSFTNLETLYLFDCKSANLLPPLGRLMSLKMLQITDMHEVKRMGKEFSGNITKFEKTFPSLQTLILERMNGLEEWCSGLGSEEEARVEFPQLQNLVVSHCPLLVGKLPNRLPLLGELSIRNCPKWTNFECRHPSIKELIVEDCSESTLKTLRNLTSLRSLKLKNIRELVCMDDELLSMFGALQVLEIERCKKLKTLVRNGKGLEAMVGLKRLTIADCEELEVLVGAGETELNYLPSLESLDISRCDKLMSFGAMRLPSSLKQMDILECKALKCLPEGFMMDGSNTCASALEVLEISFCPSLLTFPRGRFPDQLEQLAIYQCTNLESMPEFSNSIKNLTISECEHLQSLPRFPVSVISLKIENLKNLALGSIAIKKTMPIFPDSENVQYQSSLLEYIEIDNVKEIESGSEKMFVDCSSSLEYLVISSFNLRTLSENIMFFPRMKYLKISQCKNLRGLPKQIQELTCLQKLKILECPNMELLAGQDLPHELKHLEIRGCEKLIEGLFDGALTPLTSLRYLFIDGGSCCINVKPKVSVFLPKLHTLLIGNFGNLESLAAAFQLPSSVEQLFIDKCPKLRELPIDGLPSNFGSLIIYNCPMMKKRCLDRKGEYWPHLSIIPRVEIDDEDISSIKDCSEESGLICCLHL